MYLKKPIQKKLHPKNLSNKEENLETTSPQTKIMKIIRNNKTKITALTCHVVFYGDAAEKKQKKQQKTRERVEEDNSNRH